jgi:hypothetical protein
VEKAAGVITQRWWRTLGDELTQDQAQAVLDRLCVRLDGRRRMRDGIATTVGALAEAQGLRPVPAPYPAVLQVSRTVSNQARISFRGKASKTETHSLSPRGNYVTVTLLAVSPVHPFDRTGRPCFHLGTSNVQAWQYSNGR